MSERVSKGESATGTAARKRVSLSLLLTSYLKIADRMRTNQVSSCFVLDQRNL